MCLVRMRFVSFACKVYVSHVNFIKKHAIIYFSHVTYILTHVINVFLLINLKFRSYLAFFRAHARRYSNTCENFKSHVNIKNTISFHM